MNQFLNRLNLGLVCVNCAFLFPLPPFSPPLPSLSSSPPRSPSLGHPLPRLSLAPPAQSRPHFIRHRYRIPHFNHLAAVVPQRPFPSPCLPPACLALSGSGSRPLWLSRSGSLARSGSLSLTTSLERLGRAPWLPHPHPRPLCLCLPPPLPHSVSPPLLRLASSLAPSVSLPSFLSVSLHRPPVPSTVSTSTRVA